MTCSTPDYYIKRLQTIGVIISLFLLLSAVVVSADTVCDQFANLSPMPGGGFAVDSCGYLDGLGAIQTNIPVAYTPRAEYIVASGAAGGTVEDKSSFKNGTGVLGASIGGWPRLWVSGMFVSQGTATANAHLSVFNEKGSTPGVAVGIQGLSKENGCRRWGYLVATKGFGLCNRRVYTTLGIRGNNVNVRGIGGFSVPLSESFNFDTEWDGYQFNNMIAFRPGGRYGIFTAFGGYNGQTGWQAGGSIYYRFSK